MKRRLKEQLRRSHITPAEGESALRIEGTIDREIQVGESVLNDVYIQTNEIITIDQELQWNPVT